MWASIQVRWLVWIGAILLGNALLSGVLLRWDLTKEKRYSLTPLSRETARQLAYPLEVTSYMEGSYPLEISRFQQQVYTTLEELDSYAYGRIDFQYVDPNEVPAAGDTLRRLGFQPIGVRVQSSATDFTQKAMYPVLFLRYGDRGQWVDLLKDYRLPQRGRSVNVDLIKAEANLEYEIVSAMRSLLRDRPPTVAFLEGHGELTLEEIARDIYRDVAPPDYLVGMRNLQAMQGQPIDNQIDVIVIAQPRQPFSEREKYELDQYLMRGGKIFWILDYQQVDFDMSRKENTLTLLYELNLDDFFFQQGLKLNPNLVLDLKCQRIEFLQEGPSGDQFESLPWVLSPLVTQLPPYPYTRNVESILLRNSSSIDTTYKPGMRKEVFLQSSPQSQTLNSTSFLDLNALLGAPAQPEVFTQGPMITGIMLEGTFSSLFTGRSAPTDAAIATPPVASFVAQGDGGKMALISEGEFLMGEDFRGERSFAPLDNRTLFLNMLDYMISGESMAEIRAKEVVIRPLNAEKIRDNALGIRLVNMGLPVLLLVLLGLGRTFWRRRQAAKFQRNS